MVTVEQDKGNLTLLLIVSLIFIKLTYRPHGLRQSFKKMCILM
jgi:hypothetical protein